MDYQFANKMLNQVLEIDFDSFYVATIVLNKEHVYPNELVVLFTATFKAREYFKIKNQLANE